MNAVKVVQYPVAFIEIVPDALPPDIDPPPPVVTWDVNDLHNLLGHAHLMHLNAVLSIITLC
jgi:hypothetical protein